MLSKTSIKRLAKLKRSADYGIAGDYYGIDVNFPDFENCT